MVQVGGRSRKISAISEETKLLNGCKTIAGVQKRGEGEWRDVPPLSLSPRLRRFQAHLRRGRGVGLASTGTGTASGLRVRPLVGFVRIDGRLIVVDGWHARGRRRALGPVP